MCTEGNKTCNDYVQQEQCHSRIKASNKKPNSEGVERRIDHV
jgi:hypothetical protein